MNDIKEPFWLTARGIVTILAISFLGYFLFMEHRQHLFAFLPFLIILLCPLMHIFMHGKHGHGAHDEHDHSDSNELESEAYRRGLEEGKKSNHEHNH